MIHKSSEKRNMSVKRWKKKNPDKVKKYNKIWRERHWKEYYKKHYVGENRLKILARRRQSYSMFKTGLFRLRFLVLKRDNFICQYCGRKSPEAELQIDHMLPKSKGGKNNVDNLITSCRECNQGKGDVLLQ
ncbi:MAG: HNH endonuclease [Candidatus Omnitrophica bacterium]|nr:HNH endonuclease [Candidatus Omnitrophota bacterium]